MSYYRRNRSKDLFESMNFFVPKETRLILEEYRERYKIPISRLVAIAVDNELDARQPFNYPCEIPEAYTEYLYATEAQKVLEFLSRLPNGCNLQTIMLARRDIGVPGRKDIMAAIKELFEKNMVTEFHPRNPVYPGEKRIRLILRE